MSSSRRHLRSGTRHLVVGLVVALAMAAPEAAAQEVGMPRIAVRGDRLYAGSHPWRAWGMNWGLGTDEPIISYFDHPTAHQFAILRHQLAVARSMGVNSMRIYLQLGQVLATPTLARPTVMTALQRLLALATHDHVYLDITGDLVWQPTDAPAWYAHMSPQQRWTIQARFWHAVARAAHSSPAVLCYELTSEPLVAATGGYYHSDMSGWFFRQSIVPAPVHNANATARAWTAMMATAVRSQDDRPVTIGLLPTTTGPFSPHNIGSLLDMLTIHEYPTTGHARAADALITAFAETGKPVLLGETVILNDDAATQLAFLTHAAPFLSGAFEFFDGRDPTRIQPHTIYDAIYQQSLQQFDSLRPLLTGPPPPSGTLGGVLTLAAP